MTNRDKDPSVYSALLTNPGTSLTGERILWLHCVCQALIDATSRDRAIRSEVAEWVGGEDFETVCGMAGIDPVHISNAFSALLRDRNRKRAFKKAMEFRFLVRTYIESHTGDIDKRRGS